MTAHQRLQANSKHIETALAKVERIEKQLTEAKQVVTDLYVKREAIESGIIQGLMRKHKMSFGDMEQLLHSTQKADKPADKPIGDKTSEQMKGDFKHDKKAK